MKSDAMNICWWPYKYPSMLPTLKQRYEQKKPIVEALDTRELKKMGELLSGLSALIKSYDLPELQSGLQKATDDLASSIGGKWNRLKAGGGDVKANPKKLAKVASFQTAFIKGLKQLPHILEIVRGLDSAPTDEGEIIEAGPDELDTTDKGTKDDAPKEKPKKAEGENSISDGLSDKAYDRLKGIMLNAFSPPGFLAMFMGMPYVNDTRMVDEILDLPRSEFEKLVSQASDVRLKVPADRTDIQDIVKAASSQGQDGKAAKAISIEPANGPEEKTPEAPEGGSAAKPEPTAATANKPSIAASLGVGEKKPRKEVPSEDQPEKISANLDGTSFAKKLRTIFKDADDAQINGVFKYLKTRGITFKK